MFSERVVRSDQTLRKREMFMVFKISLKLQKKKTSSKRPVHHVLQTFN